MVLTRLDSLRKCYQNYFFGNVGCAINTYVRNDNSDAVSHMDSMNAVTREKRLNGFLESNRGVIIESMVRSRLYKSMVSVNLRSLMAEIFFEL